MRVVTLDWESYYDTASGYTLKKMSTEEYVTDPRFEEILVSAKVNDEPTDWFSGTRREIAEWLEQFELERSALLCQKTLFDATILAVHYGIYPAFYLDTLSMAHPNLKPKLKSLGLASLCEHFGLPPKGDEVLRADGMRRADFTPERLREYASYGCNDTDQTRALYKKLAAAWSPKSLKDELRIIDMTIRMYVQPQLELDPQVYRVSLEAVRQKKAEMFANMEVQGITKKALGSGPKFAQILRDHGIEPPIKVSPSWLKKPEDQRDPAKQFTYAFGKADPEFIDLREEFADNLEISMILNARIGAKSVQEESRAEKYLSIAERFGRFRVPVQYYSAHTGRYGGTEGLNVLNLANPREIKREKYDALPLKDKDAYYLFHGRPVKSASRFGVVAPEGHDIIAADLSQIEARLTACLAGQDDLVQIFADGECPYSDCASGLFQRPVSKALAKTDPQAEADRGAGKIIILGCGFGMGPPKFRRQSRKDGLNLTIEQAEQYVYYYRERYSMIPQQWGAYGQALKNLIVYREEQQLGPVKFVWLDKTDAAILLPNGMYIHYPRLRMSKNKETDEVKIVCNHARDKYPRNLWGGVVMENLAQTLANIIIRQRMLEIHRVLKLRTALQIYDEIVLVVPKDRTQEVLKGLDPIMTARVDWLPDLPVAYEAKAGRSYGDV
jgi:DNA polymerase I-like protein with 3'-5' exonuclease and polymerase domains